VHENHFIKRAGVAGVRARALWYSYRVTVLIAELVMDWKMKKSKLKDNAIRIIYTIVFFVVMVLAWFFRDYFLYETRRFNLISYIGTVVTMLGIIITFSEVIHSVMISRSLQKQAQDILGGFKVKEFDVLINELITGLEYIISDIDNKQFTIALRQIYSFNRTFKRINTSYHDFYGENELNIHDKINKIEVDISALKYAGPSITIPNKTWIDLNNDIMEVKSFFVKKQSSLGDSKNAAI
jgi:hypothetical protein